MKIIDTEFRGLKILRPDRIYDDRGSFAEVLTSEVGFKMVQENRSWSNPCVLRGLHFQVGEHAQAKIVTCLHGTILDIVIDLRRDEPTYGKSWSTILQGEESLVVPKGFAHGFYVTNLFSQAVVNYKVDYPYTPSAEGGIRWNDPIARNWQWNAIKNPIVSKKDSSWTDYKL